MRYVFQVTVMITELIICWAMIVVGYSSITEHNLFYAIIFFLGLWAWNDTGIFFSWRPKNIRAFLANAKKMGM